MRFLTERIFFIPSHLECSFSLCFTVSNQLMIRTVNRLFTVMIFLNTYIYLFNCTEIP